MGGGTFTDFEDDPDLNESGTVAFRAKVAGGTGNQGLFLADSAEILPIAVAGQSLEGTTITTLKFKGGNDFEGRGRAFNQYGQVAYQAALANGSSGIFVYTPTLHYRSTTSGSWDDNSHWTVGLKPGAPHDVLIDAAASVAVSGPSIGAAVNSLQIGGGAGVATLALRGGALLSAAGGTTIAATGVLTGDGALVGNVTNHGSVVAQNVRVLGGTLTNEGLIGGHGILNAAINNSTLGEVRAHAGERLRLTGPSFDNFGSVQATGGAAAPAELEFTNSVTNATGGVVLGSNSLFRFRSGLSNQSSFALSMGSNSVFGDIDNTADGTIVVSGGASATFYDDIVQSGAFRVSKVGSTTSVAVIFGDFTGIGGTTGGGDIFFEGDLHPGASPATVTFGNNVAFGSGASVSIEIGGVTPGPDYDQMHTTGALSLGGALSVSLINGFTPVAGDSFDIFDWGSLSGVFSTIELPALPGFFAWDASQLYTTGVLSVTSALPESDFDEDGDVDGHDLSHWKGGFGAVGNAIREQGDADGDHDVDGADFLAWQRQVGAPPSGGATAARVPEPHTPVILFPALIVAVSWGRSNRLVIGALKTSSLC